MKTYQIHGKVISDIKIISTSTGTPFARFTLEHKDKPYNCLIAGQKAFNFLYEVKNGSFLLLEVLPNERKQLVVKQYQLKQKLTTSFQYKGLHYPHKKFNR
ncbi:MULTISPECIES: hypothetical protein [Carnobacterium]|uniref:Uncharacterized protein n=2 Tax=Carnobacterium divergens TaxID=2748 RepID=A0A0R2I813_CARDV|nr:MULTISPECIES: hypothetical protein [Carnobacterium]AOA00759.1 hypothetical protein BFC22_11975 [Carnobacterium divergens]KRN57978.1 hypothetical protein IV74_GL001236 [Carnobacterium divergens DSM 20623]MCO6016862.1 ssDNA-binding protein [Carnobacterium divergens]MDO0874607.1 ssDNA-binding protein [Carnobacterium divergens]MDT1940583.1 hypothetical protein [Carnobacterium divergens]